MTLLSLCRTSLGDDGLQELIPCLRQLPWPALTVLQRIRVELSWKCLVEIEKLLLDMPPMKECLVSVSKNSSQAISSLQSSSLQVTEVVSNEEQVHLLNADGFEESKYFRLENKRGQTVLVCLEEEQ